MTGLHRPLWVVSQFGCCVRRLRWWCRIYLALSALGVGQLIAAQTPLPGSRVSQTDAIAQVSGLMYLKRMEESCPFPGPVAANFEFLAMLIQIELPTLSTSQLDEIRAMTEIRVDREMRESKDRACANAEETVSAWGRRFERLRSTPNGKREPPVPVGRISEYATVSEALGAVDSNADIQVLTSLTGEVTARQPGPIKWTFVSPAHYAYPALVRCELVFPQDGKQYIDTKLLCEGNKDACARFEQELSELGSQTDEAERWSRGTAPDCKPH